MLIKGHDLARVNFAAFSPFNNAIDSNTSVSDQGFGHATTLAEASDFEQFVEFDELRTVEIKG
jgi:hypothetical protein